MTAPPGAERILTSGRRGRDKVSCRNVELVCILLLDKKL